jgi:cytochrome c1
VGSCSDEEHADEEHADEELGTPTQAVCPTTQTLTYTNFGQAFMASYCLRCHSESVMGDARNGAPTDHNFDQLDVIRSLAGHIDEYAGSGPAATNTVMPINEPRPSIGERQQLSEWLACGGPE